MIGAIVATVLGLASFVVHRSDPVQATALVVVDRGANESATARARSIVETVRPRLPEVVPAVERAAIARLVNEPTISISVDGVDGVAARSGVEAIVAEVIEIGRLDWEADVVARRLDTEATLTALLSAADPAPRQQANLEGELAQIDAELATGGNFVSIVGETTTRPDNEPFRDAVVIALATLLVAAAAEVVMQTGSRVSASSW